MKTLIYKSIEFQSEKIVKTDTDIIGQDSTGKEVFSFKGISDFTDFVLEEGQAFDKVEPTQEEIIRANLLKDNVTFKLQLS